MGWRSEKYSNVKEFKFSGIEWNSMKLDSKYRSETATLCHAL
jgi:hypothetical protein